MKDQFVFACSTCASDLTASIDAVHEQTRCDKCGSMQRVPIPPIKVAFASSHRKAGAPNVPLPSEERSQASTNVVNLAGKGSPEETDGAERPAGMAPPGFFTPDIVRLVVLAVIGLVLGSLGYYVWHWAHRNDPAVYTFVKTRLETLQDACVRADNAAQALSDHTREHTVALQQDLSPMVIRTYAQAISEARSTMERRRQEVNFLQHSLAEAWLKDKIPHMRALILLRDDADRRGRPRLAELADSFIARFNRFRGATDREFDDDEFTTVLIERHPLNR